MTISTTPTNDLTFTSIGSLGLAGAEISAYDAASKRLFVTSNGGLQIVDFSNPAAPSLIANIATTTLNPTGGDVTSVAVKNGIVAVSVPDADKSDAGKVVLLDAATGAVLKTLTVGALPDMVTFTPDGSKVLVANEGEVVSSDNFGGNGSVSIIDLSNGAANATVQTADFTAFNGQKDALRAAGVRIFEGKSVAEDVEPEYIAVSPDGTKAMVTLQEANAVAILDIATGTFTEIVPLGLKDFSGLFMDASDRDGPGNTTSMNLQTGLPVFGLYMPDAIAAYQAGGSTYYVTANEGDDRDDFLDTGETIRVGSGSYDLDDTIFPNEAELKGNGKLGRLTVSNAPGLRGDTDGDGDIDRIEVYGGRSFSILDADGNIVFDSGDALELIVATQFPEQFDDTRSDNKGPEPEGVTVSTIGGRTYAFVTLERSHMLLAFDITDPANVTYTGAAQHAGDLNPEGALFISAADSPTGKALLVVSNEVSSNISVFEVAQPVKVLTGTAGNNILEGSVVGDVISGLGGNDQLTGGAGLDSVSGGTGNDLLIVANGDVVTGEVYDGGIGLDTLMLANGTTADFSGTFLTGVERLTGSGGDDTVTFSVNQFLSFDKVDGGAGFDVVRVKFSGEVDIVASPGPATVVNIEGFEVVGSAVSDTATATARQFMSITSMDLAGGHDTVNVFVNGAADFILAFPVLNGVETLNLVGTVGTARMTVAQFGQFDSIAGSLNVTLADTGANLAALTPSQVGQLASKGIDRLDATDNALALTVAQYRALGTVGLTATDHVTLADTGARIASLTAAELAAFASRGIDAIDATNDALSLSADQYVALRRTALAPEDVLTLAGSAGNDAFEFAHGFNPANIINGSGGTDRLILSGDFSAGLVFAGGGHLVNVEVISLRAGNDYDLTMNNANVAAGQIMTVQGAALGALDSLVFDGSAETNGRFIVNGGDGDDTLTGGRGADRLTGGDGADTYRYTTAAQSTGPTHDTIVGFDAAADSFDLAGSVTGVDPAINAGKLSTAPFNADLAAAVDAAHLLANHAALFTASQGTLAGATFLVVDTNGVAGYQASADLVVRLNAATNLGSLSTANFT